MGEVNIKDVVKEKYGQAALRVRQEKETLAADRGHPVRSASIQSPATCMSCRRLANCPRQPFSLPLDAAIQPRWRN